MKNTPARRRQFLKKIMMAASAGPLVMTFGPRCSTGEPGSQSTSRATQRYGRVLHVRPESVEVYKKYHREVWPEVLQVLHDAGVRNYSIYLYDDYLFSYFEYVGERPLEEAFAEMSKKPRVKEWDVLMRNFQKPVQWAREGEWWMPIEEVFHMD